MRITINKSTAYSIDISNDDIRTIIRDYLATVERLFLPENASIYFEDGGVSITWQGNDNG